MRSRASCGLSVPVSADLKSSLGLAPANGFDFVVTSLVHPRYRLPEVTAERSELPAAPDASGDESSGGQPGGGPDDPESVTPRDYAFTRSDLLLGSSDWTTLLVAHVAKEGNVESECHQVRRRAEESLRRELQFCVHLGLSAIMVQLTREDNSNLARMVYTFLVKNPGPQIWVRVPMNMETSLSDDGDQASSETWEWWDAFRSAANYEKKMGLALEVGKDPPSEARLRRWLGEPVRALILNTGVYLTNQKGYPVLPRAIQTLVRRFIPLDVQVIIEGRSRGRNMNYYQSYLDHLWQKHETSDPLKQYAKGFEDYLQSPLQPLMDNLESCTYEVFEKDPVKYTEYQRAIYLAILAKRPEDSPEKDKVLTVMVLGAGRGPLVRASLEAARKAERRIRVFAVEKNPNAVVTLLTHKEDTWGDQVKVVSSDMRKWHPAPEDRADIVVSELLGSFGDNELSPECLYSAQHVFKPDAVSIPCSYTSWVGPLQSSKLYNEVRASVDADKNPHAHYETPYVVHFQNRAELAPPKPLFTFEHPCAGPIDNNRFGKLKFTIDMDSELHGFGGYFECVLFGDVTISINPETHSKGMFSWFPIFFPLRNPVRLNKGQEVELNFWRINNGTKVWYEWSICKPVVVPIHNPNGRSYTIGL